VAVVSTTYLQMSQLKVISRGRNVAQGKAVGALSEIAPGMAVKAVDGTSAARAFPDIYQSAEEMSGWAVDLGREFIIDEIVFYNRSDGCSDRASKMHMILFDGAKNVVGLQIPFSNELEQHFTFTPRATSSTTSESSSASASSSSNSCNVNDSKQTCLGSMDENKQYCSWSDSNSSCNSPTPVNHSSTSSSQNCTVKTTKSSCTSTVVNAEDNTYCAWSDASNKCSYTAEGEPATSSYNANSIP